MDGQIWKDEWMDKQMEGYAGGQVWRDKWMDGQTRKDEWMDGQVDDGWTDMEG